MVRPIELQAMFGSRSSLLTWLARHGNVDRSRVAGLWWHRLTRLMFLAVVLQRSLPATQGFAQPPGFPQAFEYGQASRFRQPLESGQPQLGQTEIDETDPALRPNGLSVWSQPSPTLLVPDAPTDAGAVTSTATVSVGEQLWRQVYQLRVAAAQPIAIGPGARALQEYAFKVEQHAAGLLPAAEDPRQVNRALYHLGRCRLSLGRMERLLDVPPAFNVLELHDIQRQRSYDWAPQGPSGYVYDPAGLAPDGRNSGAPLAGIDLVEQQIQSVGQSLDTIEQILQSGAVLPPHAASTPVTNQAIPAIPGTALPGAVLRGPTLPDSTPPGSTPAELSPEAVQPGESLPGELLPGEMIPGVRPESGRPETSLRPATQPPLRSLPRAVNPREFAQPPAFERPAAPGRYPPAAPLDSSPATTNPLAPIPLSPANGPLRLDVPAGAPPSPDATGSSADSAAGNRPGGIGNEDRDGQPYIPPFFWEQPAEFGWIDSPVPPWLAAPTALNLPATDEHDPGAAESGESVPREPNAVPDANIPVGI